MQESNIKNEFISVFFSNCERIIKGADSKIVLPKIMA